MVDIGLFLSKLVGAKNKMRVFVLDKIVARLKLAILALILFGLVYVIVSKTVIALEFAQAPSIFVP
jgi:hypothetical protein